MQEAHIFNSDFSKMAFTNISSNAALVFETRKIFIHKFHFANLYILDMQNNKQTTL